MTTTITRANWQSHTIEPPLTPAEWQQVYAMRAACREDDELARAVFAATETELAAVQAAGMPRTGWAGMAAWADALRRLMRAELAAWEGSEMTFVIQNK